MFVSGEALHEAKELAEAICRDFAKLRIVAEDGAEAGVFTASFGVALHQPGEGLLSLIARADEALYLSKTLGRNRVSCETDVQVNKLRNGGRTHERRKYRDGLIAAQAG